MTHGFGTMIGTSLINQIYLRNTASIIRFIGSASFNIDVQVEFSLVALILEICEFKREVMDYMNIAKINNYADFSSFKSKHGSKSRR